jgi:hypothetical protein
VLNYTSLFSDLEARFRAAGQDAASYSRMAKEVARAGEDLRDYLEEVTRDYVARLERRLTAAGAQLTPEESGLLRAFLGFPPDDPERDRLLVDDLARLEEGVLGLAPLRGLPLNLRNLEVLRRLLTRMQTVLPRIVHALEERDRARRFDDAVGDDGVVREREWLLAELRRVRDESSRRGESS